MKRTILLFLFLTAITKATPKFDTYQKRLEQENQKLCDSNNWLRYRLIGYSAVAGICNTLAHKYYSKNKFLHFLFGGAGYACLNLGTLDLAISATNQHSIHYNKSRLQKQIYEHCKTTHSPDQCFELYKKQLQEENQKLCCSNSWLKRELIGYSIIGLFCNFLKSHQDPQNNDLPHILAASFGTVFTNLGFANILKMGINHLQINHNKPIIESEQPTQ